MRNPSPIVDSRQMAGGLGFFERYLSIWVALCMCSGILLGRALPAVVAAVRGWELGKAIAVMAELGIGISGHRSKNVTASSQF